LHREQRWIRLIQFQIRREKDLLSLLKLTVRKPFESRDEAKVLIKVPPYLSRAHPDPLQVRVACCSCVWGLTIKREITVTRTSASDPIPS
jgi:hypothetical protein